jgi:serine protease Do
MQHGTCEPVGPGAFRKPSARSGADVLSADPYRRRMRHRFSVLLTTTLVLLAGCRDETARDRLPGTPAAARGGAPSSETFGAVVDAVLPAIVFIQAEARPAVTQRPMFPGMQQPPGELLPVGAGSGVIYTPDGLILTNNHVVQQADRVTVMLYDRRQFEAEVVARDPSTDVAVVRIEGEGFPAARLGDSDGVRLGDWVLALGSPLGLEFTVTAGIISATGRSLGILGRGMREDPQAAPLEHFIQTDAAINPGNSGGPLVNLAGEVIGINTAIASPTGAFAGYGFAIPSNLARVVADQLVQFGVVRRPFLGVSLDNITAADAQVYGLATAEGAEVRRIEPGSPAEQAGMQLGDVVLAVGDVPVASVGDLQVALAQLPPGSTAQLRVVRFGEEVRLSVRLGEIRTGVVPERRPEPAEGPGRLGFAVVEQGGAVVVVGVRSFSAAARAGVRPRQRIVEVNRRPVASAAQVEAAVRDAGRDVVSLIVEDPQVGRIIINYRMGG